LTNPKPVQRDPDAHVGVENGGVPAVSHAMRPTDLATRNQELLARIRAQFAVEQAKFAHLPSPAQGAMAALEEAIEERAADMACLASAGRAGSPEYVQAENQHRRWNAAWRRNQ
jgi:hypothetical protein